MSDTTPAPIGVPPEKMWVEERLHRLDAAIRKRRDTPEHPPDPEWYAEYYRHMTWLIECENAEKCRPIERETDDAE